MLKGKNILIVGVANKHSIAAGIAQSMSENGANIALTYQNERLKDNVEKLGADWGVETYLPCDVASDNEIKNTFANVNLLEEEQGIAPGQACVFYSKNSLGYKVLGGGWIIN